MPKSGDGDQFDLCSGVIVIGKEIVDGLYDFVDEDVRIELAKIGSRRASARTANLNASRIAAFVKQCGADSGRADVNAQQKGRLCACHYRNNIGRRLKFVDYVIEHAAH